MAGNDVKRVSVEQAFVWAQRFAAREWRLLLPVALTFMALPAILADLLAPESMKVAFTGLQAGGAPRIPIGGLLIALGVMLLNCVGQLALIALALLPRISVAEAMTRAFARLGIFIAAGLIMSFAVLIGLVVIGVVLTLLGLKAASGQALLVGIIMGIFLFLGVRLATLMPVIVSRRVGPIAALREAAALTAGSFWPLLASILLYVFGMFVVILATSYALGTVLTLIAKLAGQPEVGVALVSILINVVRAIGAAGLQLLFAAFYRQLAGSSRGA
jgi:hypothetical protein